MDTQAAMLSLQQIEQERSQEQARSEIKQVAKNRGRIDVVADIIHCCERPSTKSHIMLVANVNSLVATRVISMLTEERLLDSIHEDASVHYLATPKGVEFVRKYWDLTSMLSHELMPAKTNGNRLENLAF